MATLNDFINYLEEQVKNHSIYVWGAQGQTKSAITEEWIRSRETSKANANRAIAFWKKQIAAGYGDVLRAFDCSGLAMYFLQNVHKIYKNDNSSNGQMKDYCTSITKSQLKRGDWVFRVYTSGRAYHVGYVVDDALNVIEAKGRDDGVVKRSLNASGTSYWNAFGRPKIFANEIDGGDEEVKVKVKGGTVNVRKEPNTTSEILGVARKGETYELGGFYPIEYKGQKAYISARDDLTELVE